MSSILTNTSSMVALQTLKGINKGLNMVQSEISTGKSVGSAKDNSAIWSISKVMESDVTGFKAISESLSLGESTVAVARQASETITDLLVQMKAKIVAAQSDNVDRDKINDDVSALRDQVESVVSAAQFNGLNLIDGTSGNVDVLSSLDRDNAGNVTASNITVDQQDLSIGGYTAADVFSSSGAGSSTDGDALAFTLDQGGGTNDVVIDNATFAEGDSVSMTVAGQTVTYTVSADDEAATTPSDMVAVGLKNKIDALGIADLTVDYDSGSPGQLLFDNQGTTDISVSGQYVNAGSGGLGALTAIDVSTDAGAGAALTSIETLISTTVDAAAAFGSAQGRIETQTSFIDSLTDNLRTGIGALVDADMEEASAKLQALQVQQQLGIQSLSIANQAPQSILSLFR